MKKNLLMVLLSCAAIEVFAQGVVQFRNLYVSGATIVDAPVTGPLGNPLDNSNTLWRAALIGGPITSTPTDVWSTPGTLVMMYNPVNTTLTWVNFRAPPNAGSVTVANASRVVPGVDWGGTALVQMVAWQGNYNTWLEAWNAFMVGEPGVLIGASNPLTLTLPTGPTDPRLTYLVGLQPFSIMWAPEPAAFALAALATAVVVMRKKGTRRNIKE